jgi:hypothetical protein
MDFYAGIYTSGSVNRASWDLRLFQVSHRNNNGKTCMILKINRKKTLHFIHSCIGDVIYDRYEKAKIK